MRSGVAATKTIPFTFAYADIDRSDTQGNLRDIFGSARLGSGRVG